MHMVTIFKKTSSLAFLISLMWVSSMLKAIFGFNISVTFMPLAFLSMGLGGGLTFVTIWKYCIYIISEVLILYYSGYSSILILSLQFLLLERIASLLVGYLIMFQGFVYCQFSLLYQHFLRSFIQCQKKTRSLSFTYGDAWSVTCR